MKLRKILAILGAVGVVAALAVGGTALAQTPTPTSAPGQAKTNYQGFFLDRLAAALGVSRDALNKAFTQARNDTVDQAVKDGKLTQQQADKIKAQQGTAPFGFGFDGPGRGKGHGMAPRGRGPDRPGLGFMGMNGAAVRDAIAQALGMTPQELTTQLRSGKTLAQLAQGKEQAVKDAVVNTIKPRLDQAVKNGRLTQDQENQMISKIQNSDLSNLKFGGPWGKGRPQHKGAQPTPTPAPSGSSFSAPAPAGVSAL